MYIKLMIGGVTSAVFSGKLIRNVNDSTYIKVITT